MLSYRNPDSTENRTLFDKNVLCEEVLSNTVALPLIFKD